MIKVGEQNMNRYITSLEDLITTHEQTRAGFLSIALEKIWSGIRM